MRALLALVLLIAASAAAAASTDPGTIAWNNKLAMHTPGIRGVFVVLDNGAIGHLQSGMVCPPRLPSVQLLHLKTFPSQLGKGRDVSCGYGRLGPDARFVSTLTLFATIAPAGATLNKVFANYRAEVFRANPGIRSIGPLVRRPGMVVLPPGSRSEAFIGHRDGHDFTNELVVGLRGKWMFEVRTTYDGSPSHAMQSSPADADNARGDRTMAAAAYVATVNTLRQ